MRGDAAARVVARIRLGIVRLRQARFDSGALTIAIALTLSTPLLGERLPVRLFTTDDGLPRDQLLCVHTDARGFVWFCTADGLVRFDGHAAVTFGRDHGLDPAGVRSFLHASDGRYWAGTDRGVVEFTVHAADAGLFKPVVSAGGRPTGWINALAESHDHAIWCAAGQGLFRLMPAREGGHLIEVDIGLPPITINERGVRAVLEDERGMLWVGASSGLYARRRDGTTRRIAAADGLPLDEVRALARGPAGGLWVGTRDGLALIDRDAVDRTDRPIVRRVFRPRDGLPDGALLSLFRGDSGLWVGAALGAAELIGDGDEAFAVRRKLTGPFTWGMTADLRGDLWMATQTGAVRIAQEGFSTYREEDGLPAVRVSSVFETDGVVCATTLVFRVAVSCFDGRRFRNIPIDALRSIDDAGWGWSQLTLQDRRGRWWVPTGSGLFRFRAGSVSALASAVPETIYDRRRGLSSDNIFRLFEDSRGAIWVATFAESGSGLARIDREGDALRVFSAQDGLPHVLPIVHGFAEDRAGSIWIGLDHGRLVRYRGGRFDEIPVRGQIPAGAARYEDELRSLIVDKRGRLFVASTITGLGRIDEPDAGVPAIRWYGMEQGLSSNTVWTLVADGSGELLIATSRGVDRFNPDTGSVVHYSAADGLPRGEIKGALQDRAGAIWFATSEGVARLTPNRRPPSGAPRTLVTAVRVAGAALPIAANGAAHVAAIAVGPGDRRVEIDFVSPGAREADGLRYQHQLEGVDRDWMTTGTRTVAVAGLAPGSYRFVVRAALASGLVGEPARVEFTVLAPFWRRRWFMVLAATCLVGAAIAAHRIRVRQLLEVERVRSRIAADLHDGVGASLSRIAILSEVVHRQVEGALPDAVPAVAEIGHNAREVIDDVSDAVWFIDPRLDNLRQIVVRTRAIAANLFDHVPIAWTLDADDEALQVALTPEQRRHLYLIVKESLTNIARHARASRVTIRFSASDRLRLEVIDDGVGVAEHAGNGGGHGLVNMRTRAATVGGDVTIAPGPEGCGTRIVFDAPL